MTTYPFTPSTAAPYQFQPTLDGATYTVTVTWNFAAKRFYFNVFTLQGALVVSRALVGSPLGYDIDLVGGYFTSSIVYRAPTRAFEVTP